MAHRPTRRLRTWIALTAVLVTGAMLEPAAANAGTVTINGCPSGAVCIYPQNAGWNNNHPSYEFFSYGYHNLSGQIGTHRVFNNQYGTPGVGPAVFFCNEYNGHSTVLDAPLYIDSWADGNLTPINSVVLTTNPSTQGCLP